MRKLSCKKNIRYLIPYIVFALMIFGLHVRGHGGDEAQNFKPKNEEVNVDKMVSKAIGIKTEIVELKTIDETIVTTGQIEEIPKNHFDINTPVQGTVSSLLVDLGSKIGIGQSVAVIQSTEIAKLQAEIDQAEAELELAQSNFSREQTLFEKGITAKKDFEASRAFFKSTEAKLKALESNLKILTGLATSDEQGTFQIKSRKSGTVVERHVTVGQVVGANQLLFHAIDLSRLWASANIYEKDIGNVFLGQNVFVSLDGNPKETYEGKLTYIGSVIDEKSRTLPVKADLINTRDVLKPGAFVQLAIHTNKKKDAILIPSKAIVDIDEEKDEEHKHIVYIKEGESYKPRNIKVVKHDKEYTEVISGLMAGEVLVISGGYQLQYAEGKHVDDEEANNKSHNKEYSHIHEHSKNENSSFMYILPGIIGLVIGAFITLLFRRKRND